MSEGEVIGYSFVVAIFGLIIFAALISSEEVIEEKIFRAIKISEEIDGEYCIKLSLINEHKIIEEDYCLPLKNKGKIQSLHEQVIERQVELEKISNDAVLSRLVNFTEVKEYSPRGWR